MRKSRCALCGGEMKPGKTTFTVDLGFGVVVVRGVPAMVCEQCGEEWMKEETAETLERIVDEARGRHAMIEVAQYEDIKKAS
ncbi:hypothetical protein HCR_17450 [Hydrogenimonas cancrithermarum]|uniref:YgiT-type zinc finger domain-containing protein n=2 Tax=Hydrogenimonas cancrithermarum TaxID=2993563 RepID=A0ABM8FM53_9BACT|nr:hypothetical protein HCR_17450 [Hydrogenimonas cancrithermarum]